MSKIFEFSGTIDVDAGTFAGTITDQDGPPVEPPPIDPPVEPPIDPPAGPPGPPGPITDLTAEASGSNAVILSWTAVAGATNYNIQGAPNGTTWSDIGNTRRTTYMISGLPAGAPYWARVFSENIDGEWGEVSNVATATTEDAPVTEPGDPGDPILYDDFEGYSLGKKLNDVTPPISVSGAKWTNARGDNPPYIVSGGYGGSSKCLGFDMRANNDGSDDYAFSEQRFKLTNAGTRSTIDEIWIEFYLYWPSNYDTRTEAQLNNNKTVLLWNEANGYWKGFGYGSEHWWGSSTRCIQLNNPRTASSNYGHGPDDWSSPPYSASNYDGANHFNPTKNNSQSKSFWDKVTDNGKWRRYRWHAKGDPGSGYTGLMQCWKDDVKIAEMTGIKWGRGSTPGWDVGYLLGWWNLSVKQNVIIKMDRVAFYTSNPGW